MMPEQPIFRRPRDGRAWRWSLVGPALFVVLLLGGCDSGRGLATTAELDEPHYRRGFQMARSGQNSVALEAFLKVIDKRGGDAPESHLEAGQLYLNHIKDPIAAIYHFRKHLELRPNSPQVREVRQLIDTSIKEFARTLPAQPLEAQVERLDLLDMLEKLKAENAALRSEIARAGRTAPPPATVGQATPPARDWPAAALSDPGPVQPVVPIEVAPAPPPQVRQPVTQPAARATPPPAPGGRTYVVQSKDTLYSISAKLYGTNTRWRDLYEANRDQLREPGAIRVGMVLRVP